MKLGVMRLNDGIGDGSFVAEDAMAVGQPCDFNQLPGLQFAAADTFANKGVALHIRAIGEGRQVGLPVGIPQELRQEAKGGVTGGFRTVDISPQSLERGGRYMLVQAFADGIRQPLKVVRRAYVTVGFALNVLTQSEYFRGVLVHWGLLFKMVVTLEEEVVIRVSLNVDSLDALVDEFAEFVDVRLLAGADKDSVLVELGHPCAA